MPDRNSILLSAEDVDTLALISIFPQSPRINDLLDMLKGSPEALELARKIVARASQPRVPARPGAGTLEEAADLFLELAEGRRRERLLPRERSSRIRGSKPQTLTGTQAAAHFATISSRSRR